MYALTSFKISSIDRGPDIDTVSKMGVLIVTELAAGASASIFTYGVGWRRLSCNIILRFWPATHQLQYSVTVLAADGASSTYIKENRKFNVMIVSSAKRCGMF